MQRTYLVVAAVVIVVAIVLVVVIYRLTRRDPPGAYDSRPMHPSFRSNRGRGR